MPLRGYFTRHRWGSGGAQRHMQNHVHPSSPLSSYIPQIFLPLRAQDDQLPKHEWELISISKGWGRQGRDPKTHAKTPVALMEPGLRPSEPGLGWGLHFMKSYTSCSFPAWCSAPLQVWTDMRKHKQDSKAEHVSPRLNQQHLDTGMAGQDLESHSIWCTTSCLCHRLSLW